MKKTSLLTCIATATIILMLSSCSKEKESAGLDHESVNNEAVNSFVEKSLSVDEDAATMRGGAGMQTNCNWIDFVSSCAVVTESGEDYPRTITIDYGTGCSIGNNITKSGKMIITLTDDMMNTGAVRTVTFDNYIINNTQIEGTREVTNTGLNETGQPVFHRIVNTTITRNAVSFDRTGDETLTWLSGYDTEACGDNIFSVTGSGTCTRPNGITRIRNIIVPLIIDHTCGYITSGVVEIIGQNGTGTINFGNGSCDDIATLTRPNGNTQEIHLHQN
jgi:hypothetical protein